MSALLAPNGGGTLNDAAFQGGRGIFEVHSRCRRRHLFWGALLEAGTAVNIGGTLLRMSP